MLGCVAISGLGVCVFLHLLHIKNRTTCSTNDFFFKAGLFES